MRVSMFALIAVIGLLSGQMPRGGTGRSVSSAAAVTFAEETLAVGAYADLLHSPTAGSLAIFRNGLLQTDGVDYDRSALRITWRTGAEPEQGDLLIARYAY